MIKTLKLMDDINLENKNKEYDVAKVLIDSNNSNSSDCSDRNHQKS